MEGSALLVINIDSSPWARSFWTGTFSWGGVSLCRELASKPMVLSCKSPGTEDSFLAWVLPMQTPCSPFFSFKSLRVHIAALGLQVWDLWKKWVLVFCSNIKWPYTWPVCLENAKVLRWIFYEKEISLFLNMAQRHLPHQKSCFIAHASETKLYFTACRPVAKRLKPLFLLQILLFM